MQIDKTVSVAELIGHQDGGYYVMLDGDQTVGHFATMEMAKTEGQKLCDAEEIPGVFTIVDSDGNEIERIARTDGRELSAQIAAFNARYA